MVVLPPSLRPRVKARMRMPTSTAPTTAQSLQSVIHSVDVVVVVVVVAELPPSVVPPSCASADAASTGSVARPRIVRCQSRFNMGISFGIGRWGTRRFPTYTTEAGAGFLLPPFHQLATLPFLCEFVRIQDLEFDAAVPRHSRGRAVACHWLPLDRKSVVYGT